MVKETQESALLFVSVSSSLVSSLIMTLRKQYQIINIVYNTLSSPLRQTIEYYDALANDKLPNKSQ